MQKFCGRAWMMGLAGNRYKRSLLAKIRKKFYSIGMPALPPLNALRAFEATARHLSMKRAGEELGVTPGAVSQLVRLLEERMTVRLFERSNRRLMLTQAGQAYAVPLRHAFRQIAEATRAVQQAGGGKLTLSAPPAFAISWLVPRLGRFRAAHPDIALRVVTSRGLSNFAEDGVDVAIRHGLGRYKGLVCDRIASVAMIPVCSPGFLAGLEAPPRVPADLARLPLLHDADRQEWPAWFQAQGVTDVGHAALDGISFDDQTLLIRAAASGHGVALVTDTLARAELDAGGLVQLPGGGWPQEFAYWLVTPRATTGHKPVAAFRAWVLAEAGIG
jgi:LysR family transcriptional regulator, glycine cleavage system transcriptional activator